MRNLRSLDSYEGLENKLLFADGQVYDFASHSLRRVQPTDRLARRCPIPYPDWERAADMKSRILSSGAAICDFYRKGGKEFHRGTSGDIEEALAGGMSRELQESAENSVHLWMPGD